MKRFKIVWKDYKIGESVVNAESIEKAIIKANNNEDEDFEELEPCGDWYIKEVIDITNII